MSPLLVTLLSLLGALVDRHRELRADPERGALSVEQAVITLALLGIITALGVVIGNAVASRQEQIQ